MEWKPRRSRHGGIVRRCGTARLYALGLRSAPDISGIFLLVYTSAPCKNAAALAAAYPPRKSTRAFLFPFGYQRSDFGSPNSQDVVVIDRILVTMLDV